MTIKVKYVGPLDSKTFRGYRFVRDVTDDARGTGTTPGVNALDLPDGIANDALQHPDVFLQWNQPVPEEVKALRLKRTDALRAEGEAGVENWYKYVAVAEQLPNDSPRKAEIRANEIAGARAQVEVAKNLVKKAIAERTKVLKEIYGDSPPAELLWTDVIGGSNDLLDTYKEALSNKETENQALRAQLEQLLAQMERDGRLSQDEDIAAPGVGEFEVGTDDPGAPPAEFPEIFAAPAPQAAIARRGRPPAAK